MSVLGPPMATPNSLKRSHADSELNETVKLDVPYNIPQQVRGLVPDVSIATSLLSVSSNNNSTKSR